MCGAEGACARSGSDRWLTQFAIVKMSGFFHRLTYT